MKYVERIELTEEELLLRLKEIHPDIKDYQYDEDGFFEIVLESGEVMSSSEFKVGTETRRLMNKLERKRRKEKRGRIEK